MLSGLLIKTAVVLGAAALGVEYGRRHPDTPWLDLLHTLQSSAGNMRAKAVSWRARKQEPEEEAGKPTEWPPADQPTASGPVDAEPPAPAAEAAENDAQRLGQAEPQSCVGQTV